MRLGDLDSLYDLVEARYKQSSGEEHIAERAILDAICEQPTIQAIPEGWIIDRANDPERAPLYRRYAQMLYEEWQKEQEART